MKKLILSGVAGAALFAGGFWSGRATSPSSPGGPETSSGGPVAAIAAGGSATNKSGAGKGAAEQQVRAFAAGRPFVKGQAKAWLIDLAATLQNARSNPI